MAYYCGSWREQKLNAEMNGCFLIQFPALPPCQELGPYGVWFGRETEGPDRSRGGKHPWGSPPSGETSP